LSPNNWMDNTPSSCSYLGAETGCHDQNFLNFILLFISCNLLSCLSEDFQQSAPYT
jgi:hypothetical protein